MLSATLGQAMPEERSLSRWCDFSSCTNLQLNCGFVQINPKHIFDKELYNEIMDRDLVLQILHQHHAEIDSFGVKRLALFGSVARGEARPDSDVDLW